MQNIVLLQQALEALGLFTPLPPEPTSSLISINQLPLRGFHVRGREMKGNCFVEWIIPLSLSLLFLPGCFSSLVEGL